jgi:hydrogenase maturation protease
LRIAVVGIGNLLLSDEGVGVRVIEELRKKKLPKNVKLYDGATLGLAILNFLDVDKAIVVDAVKGGGEPGTIYCFSADEVLNKDKDKGMISLHDLDFISAIRIGVFDLPKIIIVGIEPEKIEEGLELSERVKKAIPKAVELILKSIKD